MFISVGCKFQDQGGIFIGAGAIVTAGAAVTPDVPKSTVAGGVSAKVIRHIHEEGNL